MEKKLQTNVLTKIYTVDGKQHIETIRDLLDIDPLEYAKMLRKGDVPEISPDNIKSDHWFWDHRHNNFVIKQYSEFHYSGIQVKPGETLKDSRGRTVSVENNKMVVIADK